ncbi:hypothetical protein TNCV_3747071 [Trichonephila clavipes]|nr:hypothetical protein TNCV_3747071 [Trichonephila clavipes]
MSVPLGSRPPYMSGMKETILVLLCLGQAVGEIKLLLLGFALDILELNGMSLKVHPSCSNCNVTQATPAHILVCIGFHKRQLLSSLATVL